MTAAAFVDAVTAMKGLLPGMVEHLKNMAPKLTGTERDETIAALKPLDADIIRLEKEQDELLKKGAKEMTDIKHKRLPAIKQMAEKAERGQAEAALDSHLKAV
jgi:hypothetical protein